MSAATTGSDTTADFCATMLDAAAGPLPPAVSRAARRTLLNVIGTAVSATGAPAVTVLLDVAAEQGSEGDAQVPGLAGRLDPYWAALVTGTAAHLDDFDDTHLATVIHPGASSLATVLSLAPETEPSGAAFLGAFAVGCEAQLRIGNAISPGHYDHGWHITGTCGVFGAATAASALLGLDAETAGRALSLAATMPLGHREAFGTMTKPLHAGKAAANGVLAARLAAAGLAGPPDALGPGGVLGVLADAVDRAALTRGWELELNTFKTYPCGVVAHPAMDAAIAASDRVDPAAITAITLRCHPLVPELMGTPQPEDGLASRFSARHGVAVGLLFGRAGLAEFGDAAATSPEVARLRGLIALEPDPAIARDAAVLRIETGSGDPVEVRVDHTRGSAARPLTDGELSEKVRGLVAPALGDAAADRIRQAVDRLPAAPDVSDLLAALRPATTGSTTTPGGTAPGGTAPDSTAPGGTAPGGTAPGGTAPDSHPQTSPAPGGTAPDGTAPGGPTPNAPGTGVGAPGLVAFTASHRRQGAARNDAASHHRRPAATSGHVSTTDRILALAADPVSTTEARVALARFTNAVTTERGIAGARALQRALRAAHADGRSTAEALPAGPAWTAWVTGTAGTCGISPSILAEIPHDDPAEPDPVVAMVVCAAARALGDDAAAAVAAGLQAAAIVASRLAGAVGAGWSVPVVSGAVGAALAAGLMTGLPEPALRNALGICATQATGLSAAAGTDAWPVQAGKAAFNAVEAALLASAGCTGPVEPLDGRRGLFALFRPSSA